MYCDGHRKCCLPDIHIHTYIVFLYSAYKFDRVTMTVCGDAWMQESEVNLALIGHTFRKYLVQHTIAHRGRSDVC